MVWDKITGEPLHNAISNFPVKFLCFLDEATEKEAQTDFQPEGRCFEPDLCHCVVLLDK